MTKVGDSISAKNAAWTFGNGVAEHFDSHVEKSVPLYREGHDLIGKLSDYFIREGSVCYEIGCSTGTLTRLLADRSAAKRGARFVGLDIEPEMIDKANKEKGDRGNIEFIVEDILSAELAPADLIVSYYTIQFSAPSVRQLIMDKVYNALNWGGAFLLFEKVRGPDARFQDIVTSLYVDYKLDRGYSEAEIVSKSRSLKGVLEPFSTQGNIDLLKRAGFVDVMSIMKYVCFEGFLAIK